METSGLEGGASRAFLSVKSILHILREFDRHCRDGQPEIRSHSGRSLFAGVNRVRMFPEIETLMALEFVIASRPVAVTCTSYSPE
jgi:hypothetical protein